MVEITYQNDAENTLTLAARELDIIASTNYDTGRSFRMASFDGGPLLDTTGATTPSTPLVWGIAELGLADSEIKQAIEATVTGPVDRVEIEEARRKVLVLGFLHTLAGTGPLVDFKMRRKINMTFDAGHAYWIYNPTAGSLASNVTVNLFARQYGVWIK